MLLLAGLVTPMLLTACSKPEEPVAGEVARPVKTVVVDAPDAGGERRFPARIDALSKAELAFRVPGTIQELKVKEGDRILSLIHI